MLRLVSDILANDILVSDILLSDILVSDILVISSLCWYYILDELLGSISSAKWLD